MGYLVWRKQHRFYCATMEVDLLGDLVVAQGWGSCTSQIGNMMVTPVQSIEEGKQLLAKIAKRRKQRKYQLLH